MIKNRAIIEVEVKGRIFALECAQESTWDDVMQALNQLNTIAVEKINLAKAQMEKQTEPAQDDCVEVQ